jgi:hypothetical protein
MCDDAQWWANKQDDRGLIHYNPQVMLSKEYCPEKYTRFKNVYISNLPMECVPWAVL